MEATHAVIGLVRSWRTHMSIGVAVCICVGSGIAVGGPAATVVVAWLDPLLPYDRPDELVTFMHSGVYPDDWAGADRVDGVSRGVFDAIVERKDLFVAVHPYTKNGALEFEGEQGATLGVVAPSGFLRFLGLEPVFGRHFSPDEDRLGNGNVVILGHSYWRSRFSGDEAVIGRELRTRGDGTFVIIGVLGPDAKFPVLAPASFFLPMGNTAADGLRGSHFVSVIARRKAETSLMQIAQMAKTAAAARSREDREEVRRSYDRLKLDYSAPTEHVRITARRYRGRKFGDEERTLLYLVGLAGALAIGVSSVNAAALLAIRGFERRAVFAMRSALGASPLRLAFRAIGENLILTVPAGLAGVFLGVGVLGVLRTRIAPELVNLIPMFGFRAALVGFLFAVLAGACAAVPPMITVLRARPGAVLAGRGSGPIKADRSLLMRFVAAEVGLAIIVLLVGGLLGRSVHRMDALDRGFDPQGLMAVSLEIGGSAQEVQSVIDGVLAATQSGPDSGSTIVFGGVPAPTRVVLEAKVVRFAGEAVGDRPVWVNQVSEGFFEALSIPILRGRSIGRDDRLFQRPVAVVSESLERSVWPDRGDGLGKVIHLDAPGQERIEFTVIGVAADIVVAMGLQEAQSSSQVYVPFGTRGGPPRRTSLIAPRGAWAHYSNAVSESLREAKIIVGPVASVTDMITEGQRIQRFLGYATMVSGIAAALLALLGLAALLSFGVAQRGREIGIRRALGAKNSSILTPIISEAAMVVAVGLVVGVPLAIAVGHLMSALLFGVAPGDPVVLIGAIGIIVVMALLSTAVPVISSLRVDPADALRISQ